MLNINNSERVKSFRQILEKQKRIYLERGMSLAKINLIAKIEESIIKRAISMEFSQDEIPFILIPSSKIITTQDLMSMVHNGYRAGVINLDVGALSDVIEESGEPWYVIFGVKIEKDFFGKSPEQARQILGKDRILNTTREVIAICIHKEIPKNYLYALDSYYREGKIPLIRLYCDTPQLFYNYEDVQGRWFFTSCAYRY